MPIKTAITDPNYYCALCGEVHRAGDFVHSPHSYMTMDSNAIPADYFSTHGWGYSSPTRIVRSPQEVLIYPYCVYCHTRTEDDHFHKGTCGNCGAPR